MISARTKSIKEWIEIMNKVEKDIPAEKLKQFEECKEDSKKLDVLIGLLKKIETMLAAVAEAEQKDETDDRIHMMIHRIMTALNTDHELIGVEAMTSLMVSHAQRREIKKEVFLKKLASIWDEHEKKSDDEDDESDED